jgi:acyl carrier protein
MVRPQGEIMKEIIKKFIIDNFMEGHGRLDSDQPLFESGIIDSMGFIILLNFIEKKIGVTIKMSEISIENFDSIDKIVKIIDRKIKRS